MPDIASLSLKHPLYPWLLILACLAGGLWGIDTIGRLQDPEFPIKNAYIITTYPGSSALEVEHEVTDVIEAALQELPYLDTLTSKSLPGRSEVQVELYEHYGNEDLPQIWDELRRRVSEAAWRLPPGTGTPLVEDDFGDVYGILYSVYAPGYSAADIHDMSRFISSRLNLVKGVAKVATAGEPMEAVHVELGHQRLVRLGLPIDAVFRSIGAESRIVGAGSVSYGDRRLRVAPELAFDSVEAIGNMRIGRPGSMEIMRLADVATITRGPVEVPLQIVRHQSKRVFTVGVSITDGANVVEVGAAIDARMTGLLRELPLGVEIAPIYQQHEVVQNALNEFLRNLGLSVATVVGALCLFMGWRAGTVVGSVLLLTVLGTICVMAFLGIELQRISLGALMITMGMLVDNAIVITEGMVVGVSKGSSPGEAAAASVRRTQFPLLGATVIGLLAFAPISLSADASGYFLRSLFDVVAISLLLSWILATTVVPLLGSYLLKAQPAAGTESDIYAGAGYVAYRGLLGLSLRYRWLSCVIILAITGTGLWGFGFVKQGFFPSDRTPLFYVDYLLPQGTDILTTAARIQKIESLIEQDDGVVEVASFIGMGMSRFASTVRPEQPNPAMAQLVVRVHDVREMTQVMARIQRDISALTPQAQIQTSRSEFTPAGNSKIEARFSGPDSSVLRGLADKALDIYLSRNLIDRKTDWRQHELEMVPEFNAERARLAGVSRADVYQSLAFATQGVRIGLFRDEDKMLPIIGRAPLAERSNVHSLSDRLVWSPTEHTHIPMSHVVSSFTLRPQDSRILRRQRIRTISALANAPSGHNVTEVFNRLRAEVETIPMPPGYSFEWGGEYEASKDAERLIFEKVPMTFGIMFFITVLMFGNLRQPLVIWLTVPMVVCGVVLSLLVTDMAFTFPAFLGLLSLSGMLIKNCVVLVDEIDKRLAEGEHDPDVIIQACISRLRPVTLATGTTIAGMSPLLTDPFFAEMAVCIMGGLAFATLLTLIAVPVFYRLALGSATRPASSPAGAESTN